MVGGLGAAGALLVVLALLAGGSGSSTLSTSSTTAGPPPTPESTAPQQSAAGKPCVPQAEPSPPGAPTVPVKPGPPPTSLVVEDLKPGTGAAVPPNATVTVNYIGVSCSTGKVFDTSFGKQPATFPLNGVIQGWQQGIPGMKVGGQRLLGIPSDLAYGSTPRSRDIAADEALWFVIDLIDVQPA